MNALDINMKVAQTIVVTGASRGIGAATAVELARRGYQVACLSRSGDIPLTDSADAESLRGRFLGYACDVTDETSLAAVFQTIAQATGGFVGLVNNAGIHREERARSMTTEAFRNVLDVNAVSTFVSAREAYPYLVESGGGLIVNIGSFFDRLGVKGSVAYCASKAAVAAMTRCLAAEWGAKKISVLNVAPGYIETDVNREYLSDADNRAAVSSRIFAGRPGRPDEVARLVASLFCENIQFLTGETICIDGGQSVSL